MTSTTRIYVVSDNQDASADPILVEATSQSQAIGRVTRDRFVAQVASAKTVIGLVGAGQRVLTASAEPAQAVTGEQS